MTDCWESLGSFRAFSCRKSDAYLPTRRRPPLLADYMGKVSMSPSFLALSPCFGITKFLLAIACAQNYPALSLHPQIFLQFLMGDM